MANPRIHLTGASGAGVSTLGRALARRLDAAWLDTDDFYWVWGVEPYTVKRPVADRLELLGRVLDGAPRWVLSGSLDGWGDPLIPRFDLVVFVATPTPVRLERLRRRERQRYGAAIDPGGARHEAYKAFLAWAAAYDDGSREGRSLARHEAWLARLPCPVLRIDGRRPTSELVEEVLGAISA
jgi:adenylate kinase family enzyme